jgi:hypothetical protein
MAVNSNTRGVFSTPNKLTTSNSRFQLCSQTPFSTHTSFNCCGWTPPCHGFPRAKDRPRRPFQVRCNSLVVTASVQSATAVFWCALLTMMRLYRFYTSGKFADFEIYCHGHAFSVHKIVICASSKYFEALCGGSFRVRKFWIHHLVVDSLIPLSRKRPRSP